MDRKYKVLKDFYAPLDGKIRKKGDVHFLGKNEKIYEIEFRDLLLKNKFIQEIENNDAPKFKVGDYVVEPAKYNNAGKDEYIKITSVIYRGGKYQYNTHYGEKNTYSYLIEEQLRKPTQEELDLYFR